MPRTTVKPPPRLPSLKRQLASLGFAELYPEVMRTTLFCERTSEVGMYLTSKRYSALHDAVFTKSAFRFAEYRRRCTIQDPDGTLAHVSASVRRNGRGRHLYSAAIKLPMSRFASLVEKMTDPVGLFDALYLDGRAQFLWIPDGPWTFLFLAAERGMTRDEILRWVFDEPGLEPEIRTWRPRDGRGLGRKSECARTRQAGVGFQSGNDFAT